MEQLEAMVRKVAAEQSLTATQQENLLNAAVCQFKSEEGEPAVKTEEGEPAEPKKEGCKRSSMQDWRAFPAYLTESQWKQCLNLEAMTSLACLHFLVDVCFGLGLRCPSEKTQAAFAAFLILREGPEKQNKMKGATQLRDLFLTVKNQMSGRLSRCKQSLRCELPGGEYLEVLPVHTREVNDSFQKLVLQSGGFVEPKISLVELHSLAADVSLRKTNKALNSDLQMMTKQSNQFGSFGGMNPYQLLSSIQLLAQAISMQQPQRNEAPVVLIPAKKPPLQQLLDRAGSVEEAPTNERAAATEDVKPTAAGALVEQPQHTGACAQSTQVEMPAGPTTDNPNVKKNELHTDEPTGAKEHQSNIDKPMEATTRKVSVLESVRRLQQAGKAMPPSSPEPVVKRKPAASKLKRPAASVMKETFKKPSCAPKEALRAKLLEKVPAALKKRFENGCSTCRFRPGCTNSCWAKRGFHI